MTKAPLTDDEVVDILHRMAFDLFNETGETTAGDTALKASRGALIIYMIALISANEPPKPPG